MSLSIFFGTLMIFIAWKGHFFTHIPHPTQRTSEIEEIVEVGITSIQSASVLFTGQPFLHSCLHLLGLHFSGLTIAILCLSYILLNYNFYQLFSKTKNILPSIFIIQKIIPFDTTVLIIVSCYLLSFLPPS